MCLCFGLFSKDHEQSRAGIVNSIPPYHRYLAQCLAYGRYYVYSSQVNECFLFWSYFCLSLSFIILRIRLRTCISFLPLCPVLSLKVLTLLYSRVCLHFVHYLLIAIPTPITGQSYKETLWTNPIDSANLLCFELQYMIPWAFFNSTVIC